MVKNQRVKRKINNFMFDHRIINNVLKGSWSALIAIIAAFIFAFGFCCFITPLDATVPSFKIVTGGISGLTQNLNKIVEIIFGKAIDPLVLQGIGYTCFNLPLLIFAFFKIGKRFALFSALNVIASSIFMMFVIPNFLMDTVAGNPIIADHSPFLRVILGALFTGVSSGIAFKGNFSCGGIDIVTYYLSLRKSTSVGKYGVIVNSFIVVLYSILLMISPEDGGNWSDGIISLLISILYLLFVSIVIDAINLRNKKVQITLISSHSDLGQILIANFPHGATVTNAKGVYANSDRYIFYMIVSSNETNEVIKLARRADLHAFITVTSLQQVYGNFFIKPIE